MDIGPTIEPEVLHAKFHHTSEDPRLDCNPVAAEAAQGAMHLTCRQGQVNLQSSGCLSGERRLVVAFRAALARFRQPDDNLHIVAGFRGLIAAT